MEKGMFYPRLLVLLAPLCVGAVLCGCAHTHNVDSAFSRQKAQAILPDLTGREVRIGLENGNEAEGYVRALEADTLNVSTPDTTMLKAIGYKDIQKMTVYNDGNAIATWVGAIVGGVVGAQIAHDRSPSGGIPDLSGLAVIMGGAFGVVVGSGTVSLLFPVRDTYVFRASPSETLLVRVDKLIEESATGILVRIGERSYLLPGSECTLVRSTGGVYVRGPRAVFTTLGVPVH